MRGELFVRRGQTEGRLQVEVDRGEGNPVTGERGIQLVGR